jgi:predicted nucleic acid-binding protein
MQIHRPTIPAGLLDYLEQLKKIEMQRKREASNYWVALSALDDLLKALKGVASTGDILDAPEYNPQKTLQTYDAYLQRFLMLRQWLHQLSPPVECQQLHQSYDQALLAHIGTINSLKQRIALRDLAGTALSGLTAQKQINTALNIADNELTSVCQRYGITKLFTIGDNR